MDHLLHQRSRAPQPGDKAAPKTRLIPVNQWPEHHPWPNVGGLRWMIFEAKTNGFEKAIRRVGRRVLIDEAAFFAWVDAQNDESAQWE